MAEDPPAKRRKQSSVDFPITDLIDICLEKILEYLPFEDLLNVADTNNHLREAANSVYRRKLHQECVQLNPNKFFNREKIRWFPKKKIFAIFGLENSLRFLRCFGHQQSQLIICYEKSSRKDRSCFDRCVNTFCAETLTHITYFNKPTILMEIPSKPFNRTTKLYLSRSNLGTRLDEILEFFPNLNKLRLNFNRFDNKFIDQNCPHLEILTIENDGPKKYRINHLLIVKALRLNPQLQKLFIKEVGNTQYPFTNLLEIARNAPKINLLEIDSIANNAAIDGQLIVSLANALPMMEQLFIPHVIQPADAIQFITRCPNLQFLEFKISDPPNRRFNELRALLTDGWRAGKTGSNIQLSCPS